MKKYVSILLFLSTCLFARLDYSILEYVDYPKHPSFSFTPSKTVNKLEVVIKKDGQPFIKKTYKDIFERKTIKLKLKQKEGECNYEISLKGTHIDDESIQDSFTMKGVRVKPIQLFFKASEVDVEHQDIKFSASRAISKTEVIIYNPKKEVIHQSTNELTAPVAKGVEVTWPKLQDEILTIHIKAFDQWGYWSGMNVNPFSVHIPHKEIEFASGKWQVAKTELPKLKDSHKKVVKAIDKYGKALKLKLYIAGYTDTVGPKKSNQTLSEKRARSIAKTFKKLGLKIPVYYQGFGESVLKKKTKDEVDEILNRRAIYVLSSQAPATSKTIPNNQWKRVK